jgi:hypothetical protein
MERVAVEKHQQPEWPAQCKKSTTSPPPAVCSMRVLSEHQHMKPQRRLRYDEIRARLGVASAARLRIEGRRTIAASQYDREDEGRCQEHGSTAERSDEDGSSMAPRRASGMTAEY